jgi:hypothetical protein
MAILPLTSSSDYISFKGIRTFQVGTMTHDVNVNFRDIMSSKVNGMDICVVFSVSRLKPGPVKA